MHVKTNVTERSRTVSREAFGGGENLCMDILSQSDILTL